MGENHHLISTQPWRSCLHYPHDRVQCRKAGIRQDEHDRVGHRWPAEDQAALETLLRGNAGPDLRCRLKRYRPSGKRRWYIQACVANKGDGLYEGLAQMEKMICGG